jgi:hypothetical protein
MCMKNENSKNIAKTPHSFGTKLTTHNSSFIKIGDDKTEHKIDIGYLKQHGTKLTYNTVKELLEDYRFGDPKIYHNMKKFYKNHKEGEKVVIYALPEKLIHKHKSKTSNSSKTKQYTLLNGLRKEVK